MIFAQQLREGAVLQAISCGTIDGVLIAVAKYEFCVDANQSILGRSFHRNKPNNFRACVFVPVRQLLETTPFREAKKLPIEYPVPLQPS